MVVAHPATRHCLVARRSDDGYLLKELCFRLRADRCVSAFEVNSGRIVIRIVEVATTVTMPLNIVHRLSMMSLLD